MRQHRQRPHKAINLLSLLLAITLATLLVALQFLIFHPASKAIELLIPGISGSVMAVLLVLIFRRAFFGPIDELVSDDQISELADRIANRLAVSSTTAPIGVRFFPSWEQVPWDELFCSASEVELFASFMDSWISQTSDLLEGVLARGGRIRMFLPQVCNFARKNKLF